VFDAHAHRRGAGLEGDARVVQHLQRVPGVVPHGEHRGVGPDALAVGQLQRAQTVRLHLQPDDGRAEADLAPQLRQPLSQARQQPGQYVGTEVRARVLEDRRIGAEVHQVAEHRAGVGRARACVDLAVGEGAGAALAEHHVALGIQVTVAAEPGDAALATADRLAALQHARRHPRSGQLQRSEQARRAGADHDGSAPRGHRRPCHRRLR